MAKFSFADADEDHPPVPVPTTAGDKRKRDGGGRPDDDAAGAGTPPKARKLAGDGREVRRGGGDGDAGISMRIDPDLLDCSICFEPLCPPLYQCQNGHVACFSCWSRLSNKCHICSHSAIFARNIALEKIVESIKSSCAGFTGCWSGHFLVDHSADCLHFVYGQSFEVNLEEAFPFLVLLEEDDHLFLLLNKNMAPFGHAFAVVCLRTGDLNWKFYEIKATSEVKPENCLQLNSSVTNTKEWGGVHPGEAFLLVPYDLFRSANLTLNITVARCASI